MKYTTVAVNPEDANFIRGMAKKGGISIVEITSKLINLVRGREAEFLSGQLAPGFEEILDKYAEKIRKGMVKENNRILGIYMNTNKMVRSMNRDMHYLLNWNQEDRIRLHPFFAEYEFQIEIILLYLEIKYKIKDKDELINDMKQHLTKAQMEDFLLAMKRTTTKNLSFTKY